MVKVYNLRNVMVITCQTVHVITLSYIMLHACIHTFNKCHLHVVSSSAVSELSFSFSLLLANATVPAVAAAPTVPPAPAKAATPAALNPAAPTDCSVATIPPATVGAIADIMDAAMDPDAIPPAVKPRPATTSGAATTTVAPPTTEPAAMAVNFHHETFYINNTEKEKSVD